MTAVITNENNWTRKQVRAQEWLAVPKYERVPPNQKLLAAELGVIPVTVSRWKRQPGWWDEVNAIAEVGLERSLPEVYGALIRGAEAGEIQHIRTILELIGKLNSKERKGSSTQIAIVFGNPFEDDDTDSVDAASGTTYSIQGPEEIQHRGLWSEMGENGDRENFSSNGNEEG